MYKIQVIHAKIGDKNIMKNQEYTPLFNYDDELEQKEIIREKCIVCKKEKVSLLNGICFECRQKETAENEYNNIQEQLFSEFYDDRTKQRMFPFMAGWAWTALRKYGFGGWIVAGGILDIIISVVNLLANEFSDDVILSLFFGVLSIIIGALVIKLREDKKTKKFLAYNQMQVDTNEFFEWKCPCCKTYNIGNRYCEKCGVFPKLVRKKLH